VLSSDFEPLAGGLHNRLHALPSIGFALVVYSVIMIAVTSAVPDGPRAPLMRALLTGAAAIAIGVGYTVRVRDDARTWDRAASLQHEAIAAVGHAVGTSRRGAAIFTFDHPAFTAPGVPVFNESDDLDAAVKVNRGNHGQHVYPTLPAPSSTAKSATSGWRPRASRSTTTTVTWTSARTGTPYSSTSLATARSRSRTSAPANPR
jgi:hypothetical protein